MSGRSDRLVLALLVGPGVILLSTAVILVKLSELPPGVIAVSRLWGAALMLLPVMLYERRRRPDIGKRGLFRPTLVPGLFLAAHFVTWFIGIRLTTAANATLIVNLSPVVMPFILFALVGERVNRREIVGSGLAVAGVIVLGAGSAKFAGGGLLGDAICMGSMTLAVTYLVLARRNGASRNGIGSYLVPLYAVAGSVALGYAVLSGELASLASADVDWGYELWLMFLLALMPTALGHGYLNFAITRLRGQVVAVAGLGQIPSAAILAVPLLGELPDPSFYPACALIAAGAVVAILRPRRRPTEPEAQASDDSSSLASTSSAIRPASSA